MKPLPVPFSWPEKQLKTWLTATLLIGFALMSAAQEIPAIAPQNEMKQSAAPTKSGGTDGKSAFYGIELEGRSITFLLDISGSMSGSKMDGLKAEMRRITVGLLKPGQNGKVSVHGVYRIYVFSSGRPGKFPPQGSARVGAAEAFNQATEFVDGLRAGGGTNMLNAWNFLLDDYDKQLPNTVYFLSDGVPSDCTPQTLIEALRKRNPVCADGAKTIKIHCISIGQVSQLLKDIAEEHGGRYIEIHNGNMPDGARSTGLRHSPGARR